MCDEDWKKFYDENPPPDELLEVKMQLTRFCNYHISKGNKVVLITSGGTTVPLEHSTVRFVDNFSAGNRGAASAEYFLRSGWAVIFMHRSKSVEPFLRKVSLSKILESSSLYEGPDGSPAISVQGRICEELIPVVEDFKKYHKVEKMILMVEFSTLSSYLHMLYIAAQVLRFMGKDVILYMAAAVSDFYIPQKDMSIHKICSDEGLNLSLRVVPKMLQPLVRYWIPDAFVISFKLETDSTILLKKARKALERYGHKLVIANELKTRKQRVVFVTKEETKQIALSDEDMNAGKDIEEIIVAEILKNYSSFIQL
nr:phosphopantothenate--cysteine ligase [Parasteatoda tepidariorum]XP_042910113.1 phosphopantothenate--cysteine ligase [Parasteatoda tepidariorum]